MYLWKAVQRTERLKSSPTRSCRVIQGLHENLITDLGEGSYEDEIDSASGEFGGSNYQQVLRIDFDNENEGIKSGSKLPKSSQQWSVANDLFKAEFLNKAISSAGLNKTIKELIGVIYNYFRDTCGTVDNTHNRQLSVKYTDKTSKDLKRMLKTPKRSGGDIEEIKYISRKLRHMLRNGNSSDSLATTITNFDHDRVLGTSLWDYVKRFLISNDNQLPSFTKQGPI